LQKTMPLYISKAVSPARLIKSGGLAYSRSLTKPIVAQAGARHSALTLAMAAIGSLRHNGVGL
jgi:hypothetical protein